MKSILAAAFAIVLLGCGGTTGTPAPGDGGTVGDLPASTGDMPRAPDMAQPANARHVTAKAGQCYTLATTATTNDNPCGGDIYFLQGFKVDIGAGGGADMVLCQLPGTFASLGDVPTDYKGCTFSPYVEGADGLAGAGLIVIDRAKAHHYRWRIQSNDGSDIVFDQAPID